jgi:hypothetical protein
MQSLASSEDEGDEAGLPRFEQAHSEVATGGEAAGAVSVHGGGVLAVVAAANVGGYGAGETGEQARQSAAMEQVRLLLQFALLVAECFWWRVEGRG